MSTREALEVLDALRADLTRFSELELNDLPGGGLLTVARELQPLLNALDAQLTGVLGSIHSRGAAFEDGFASTRAWARARLRTGQCGVRVRAAAALSATPELAAAYARGDISLEHVSTVASVVPDIDAEALSAGADKLLAEQALELAPEAFRRAAVRIRDHFEPDAADRRVRRMASERWLSVARTFEGAVSVQGVLDPDGGELLLNTLGALMPAPSFDDARTSGQRRADALLDLCRLAGGRAPVAGGEKPHVTVTLDWETLSGQVGDLVSSTGRWRGATLGSGTPIRPETARRLACDATIIPMVLCAASEPLDVGRATRWPPPAIRRAVINRDGRCRFPGCDRPPQWTDLHHLRPWFRFGKTAVRNLILLCRAHHVLVHEGGWQIYLDHDSGIVTVRYPDGRPYDLVSRPRAQSP